MLSAVARLNDGSSELDPGWEDVRDCRPFQLPRQLFLTKVDSPVVKVDSRTSKTGVGTVG